MQPDGSMPSYVTMFDDPVTGPEDESRSVYSPAAYLADLLQLLGDQHGGAPAELLTRRPDIERVPLDAANTSMELPYLEIVNEVLGSQLDPDDTVDLGYPRALAHLRTEPRLGNLDAALDRVDGALADRRTVHLFSGRDWYAVLHGADGNTYLFKSPRKT